MVKLKVDGMTCAHCKAAVEKAIKEVLGVEDVEVSLDDGFAVVRGSAEPKELVEAVKEAGYEAKVEA
ncbi:MAG: heavy metal-binding protein [Bacillota bacterium]|nr:MAG: heavy metal-binding protein [Bacillota bacterium]